MRLGSVYIFSSISVLKFKILHCLHYIIRFTPVTRWKHAEMWGNVRIIILLYKKCVWWIVMAMRGSHCKMKIEGKWLFTYQVIIFFCNYSFTESSSFFKWNKIYSIRVFEAQHTHDIIHISQYIPNIESGIHPFLDIIIIVNFLFPFTTNKNNIKEEILLSMRINAKK